MHIISRLFCFEPQPDCEKRLAEVASIFAEKRRVGRKGGESRPKRYACAGSLLQLLPGLKLEKGTMEYISTNEIQRTVGGWG